jgi:hypothetical protein
MRRVAHTIAVITHLQPDGHDLCKEARARKVRISARLARSIQNDEYSKRPNDLLRDLTREVCDRIFLCSLYSLYDKRERARQAENARKSNARLRRTLTLDEKFLAANPERYARLQGALLEEARLRKLGLPENMLRAHCYIFKNFFDWSTPARLKKLLALDESAFHQRMYSFASELAISAACWERDARFDWKQFRYAGFDRKDYFNFMNERAQHLETLGLDHTADLETIRKRYKLLAKQHHPDLGGQHAHMCELNAAYAFLARGGET